MNTYRQIINQHLGIGRDAEYVEKADTIENERQHCFVVSVDLGKHQDFTFASINDLHKADRVLRGRTKFDPVMGVLSRKPVVVHRFSDLHRYPIGTSYPDLIRSIKDVMAQLPRRPSPPHLVVDATGVGQPVCDLMSEEGLRPFAITITGGQEVTNETWRSANVPKSVLASSMDAALASNRVHIVNDDGAAQVLKAEMQNFRTKVRASGSLAYEAWRSSDHDDGVLSVAMSIWRGQNLPRPTEMKFVPLVRN